MQYPITINRNGTITYGGRTGTEEQWFEHGNTWAEENKWDIDLFNAEVKSMIRRIFNNHFTGFEPPRLKFDPMWKVMNFDGRVFYFKGGVSPRLTGGGCVEYEGTMNPDKWGREGVDWDRGSTETLPYETPPSITKLR